jgi:hypothetical protein
MPVTLNANALITLADAKTFCNITGSSQDDLVTDLINRASTLAERLANRPFKERDFTNIRLAGPCDVKLFPWAIPIDTSRTITILVDGVQQTVWRTESDGDPATKDVIVASDIWDPMFRPDVFYRSLGWAPSIYQTPGWAPLNPYRIVLTYSGGLPSIPDDLREAGCLIVQKFLRDQQKGLAEVVSVTTPGGNIQMLDTSIPRRSADIIARYTRFALAIG